MIHLRNSLFFWAAICLLASLIWAEFAEKSMPDAFFPGMAILFAFLAIAGTIKYPSGRQILGTIAMGLMIFTAGHIRYHQCITRLYPSEALSTPLEMKGTIVVKEVLKVRADVITLKGEPVYLIPAEQPSLSSFADKYILVKIKEAGQTTLFPGDRIHIRGWVSPMKPPLNPHAFDLRKYYSTLGIRHQISCKMHDLQMRPAPKNSLLRQTARWQASLSSIVRTHTRTEVAQLTNALVWGARSDMQEEVRDAFADSGAMHVLSVSGMHVAIIYSMLYLVLGAPGSGTLLKRSIRLCAYSAAIILYMGLTGACPAVVRAGMMILLYLLGKAMGWNTQIWNLLGFSAFIMLWYDPQIWKNIGFQLSFLAMAGILLYTRPIARSITFKNIILQRTWDITAVSIAAQIFIVPVLLKQFHQFPVTFIASSLVAMPAGYIIIFGAILNVCLSALGVDALWFYFDHIGFYFISCMKWMAALNPAMNFSLTSLGSMLLSGMAILYSIALIRRWHYGKKIAYLLGISAFISLGFHRTSQWGKDEVIIYHNYSGMIIDIIAQGRCTSILDCSLSERQIEFTAHGYRSFRDIIGQTEVCKEETYYTPHWNFQNYFLQFQDTGLLIWSGNEISDSPTRVTHLLVDDCPDITAFHDYINRQTDLVIILPAHLRQWRLNKLILVCAQTHHRVHDISRSGYYKLPV